MDGTGGILEINRPAVSAGIEPWFPILADVMSQFADATADLDQLVPRIAERVAALLDVSCSAYLLSADGQSWSNFARHARGQNAATLNADASAVPAAPDDPAVIQALTSGLPLQTDSELFVPVFSRGRHWGLLVLSRSGSAQPTLSSSELLLVRHLAQAAAQALEYASVLEQAERRLSERQRMADRLQLLAQASREFSAAAADYRELLRVIVQTAGERLGDICSIRLISADGAWLRGEDACVFYRDVEIVEAFRQLMLEAPLPVDYGLVGKVLASNAPLLLASVDPEELVAQALPLYRPLIARLDIVSVLIVPIRSQGRAVGVLGLNRRRGTPGYEVDDLHLAQDLADRAGLAIENATLLRDLARRVAENKKAEEKFRGLLESAPDAIVIIDPDGKIVLANAQTEAIFGYARGELLGQAVEVLIPTGFRQRHPELRGGYFHAPRLRHVMAEGVDLYGLRKDGSEFAAEISLSPIDTSDGPVVTAVIRDITERKRFEQARAHSLELETQNRRAQEANRLKSEFLANMSHELRTPLNAIIGFSSLLHAGKAGTLSETQVEYLGDILVSSRHLLQLINDVLDLAKVEAGRIELQPEPVDLKRLALEVRDILRGLAAEKHMAISFDVDPSLTDVVADARLLKQILYNYLSNALKFTADGGKVSATIVANANDSFCIRVEDNGIGIKPDDLGRLFVEFQQLDSSTAKKYAGTGLGLALTKRIVEAQGGSVSVTSTLGEGSAFVAVLPRRLTIP